MSVYIGVIQCFYKCVGLGVFECVGMSCVCICICNVLVNVCVLVYVFVFVCVFFYVLIYDSVNVYV